MANINAAKSLTHSHIPARWMLNHITPGKRLRLRDDVYKQIKQREWILNRIDSEGVHLLHESRAYGLIVRIEDVDWSDFHTKPSKGDRRSFFQAEDRKSLRAAESLNNTTSDTRAHRPNMSQTVE